MRKCNSSISPFFAAMLVLFLAPISSAVEFDWVTVGHTGNACEVRPQGCFGSVAQAYQISTTEVTNAQYVEFLNSIATVDSNGLYHTAMASGFGGIARSFDALGNITYTAISGRENFPVNWVSFWNTLRFANWLHNGQPIGSQDETTTEDGAYTITAAGISANSIVRNSGATIFLPSEDEWYKAAYYEPISDNYFDSPTGTEILPTCTTPGAAVNTANCDNVVSDLTNVGTYIASPSPSGTFDQGGNLYEWNEANSGGLGRMMRGGSFNFSAAFVSGRSRTQQLPALVIDWVGFRVASLAPAPPSVPSMSRTGLAVISGLLMLASYLRIRP